MPTWCWIDSIQLSAAVTKSRRNFKFLNGLNGSDDFGPNFKRVREHFVGMKSRRPDEMHTNDRYDSSSWIAYESSTNFTGETSQLLSSKDVLKRRTLSCGSTRKAFSGATKWRLNLIRNAEKWIPSDGNYQFRLNRLKTIKKWMILSDSPLARTMRGGYRRLPGAPVNASHSRTLINSNEFNSYASAKLSLEVVSWFRSPEVSRLANLELQAGERHLINNL